MKFEYQYNEYQYNHEGLELIPCVRISGSISCHVFKNYLCTLTYFCINFILDIMKYQFCVDSNVADLVYTQCYPRFIRRNPIVLQI